MSLTNKQLAELLALESEQAKDFAWKSPPACFPTRLRVAGRGDGVARPGAFSDRTQPRPNGRRGYELVVPIQT